MSYDIHLYVEITQGWEAGQEEVFWRNHTSNTSKMWAKAGCDLTEFHGKTARELAPSLYGAIQEMTENPETYREMEPANGWGTYPSTIGFLVGILYACTRWPDAKVEVSQ